MHSYIYACRPNHIEDFEAFLQAEFDSDELCYQQYKVYGSEFTQNEDKSVTITQFQKSDVLKDKP